MEIRLAPVVGILGSAESRQMNSCRTLQALVHSGHRKLLFHRDFLSSIKPTHMRHLPFSTGLYPNALIEHRLFLAAVPLDFLFKMWELPVSTIVLVCKEYRKNYSVEARLKIKRQRAIRHRGPHVTMPGTAGTAVWFWVAPLRKTIMLCQCGIWK